MTPEFLNSTLEHLYERPKEGKQHWNVEVKTSEYKEESRKAGCRSRRKAVGSR